MCRSLLTHNSRASPRAAGRSSDRSDAQVTEDNGPPTAVTRAGLIQSALSVGIRLTPISSSDNR